METRIMFLIIFMGCMWLLLSKKGKEIIEKLTSFMK
jgi:cbb3-type cytochrome oxidase subunit 3